MDSVFLSFALSLAFTHLYLLLAQSDTFYDLHALAFVGLGVLLICSFKNCVIFGAVTFGQQNFGRASRTATRSWYVSEE